MILHSPGKLDLRVVKCAGCSRPACVCLQCGSTSQVQHVLLLCRILRCSPQEALEDPRRQKKLRQVGQRQRDRNRKRGELSSKWKRCIYTQLKDSVNFSNRKKQMLYLSVVSTKCPPREHKIHIVQQDVDYIWSNFIKCKLEQAVFLYIDNYKYICRVYTKHLM